MHYFRTTATLVRPWIILYMDIPHFPLDDRHLGRTHVGNTLSYSPTAPHSATDPPGSTSLFSLRPRHGWSKAIMCWWMIQSDQLLLSKDIMIPLPRMPFSLLWRATGPLRLRSLDILPPLCDLSSQSHLGRVLSAQEFFLCDYTILTY